MNTYIKITITLLFAFIYTNIATAQRIYFDTQLGAGLSTYVLKMNPSSAFFYTKTQYPNNLQPILRPEVSVGTNYEFSPQWSVRLGVDAHWNGSYHRDTFTGQSNIIPDRRAFHVTETERSVQTVGLSLAATYQIKELLYARIGAYLNEQLYYTYAEKMNNKAFGASYFKETNTEYYPNDDRSYAFVANTQSYTYIAGGTHETQEIPYEDFGIFGGFGKTWKDRYSLDLSYWTSLNVLPVSTNYGVISNPMKEYSLRAVMLKLSFGYRFGKINIGKKK
jgi:hypothetical protein